MLSFTLQERWTALLDRSLHGYLVLASPTRMRVLILMFKARVREEFSLVPFSACLYPRGVYNRFRNQRRSMLLQHAIRHALNGGFCCAGLCAAASSRSSLGVAQILPRRRMACRKARHFVAEEEKPCCACRHKNTERTTELQQDITKRLNRAIGQLNGVKDMVADNRYCGDVLVQLAAAESAVHRIAEIVLQDHMETCVVEQVRAGNVEVVDEAMRLIKKFM